jgi:hypothetical protein
MVICTFQSGFWVKWKSSQLAINSGMVGNLAGSQAKAESHHIRPAQPIAIGVEHPPDVDSPLTQATLERFQVCMDAHMPATTRTHGWLRRFVRFSLFSLLAAITLASAGMGWARHRAERQRHAVEWILSQGGEIRYEHYRKLKTDVCYEAGSEQDKAQRAALRPDNSWVANLLGEHYVHRIERVLFQQSKLDGDLWELKHAYGAKQFLFVDCNLTANVLAAIGECKSVEQMNVVEGTCDATGLVHLAQLPRLKELFLQSVTLDKGALRHLANCKQLETLDLTYCTFPPEELPELRTLPRLTRCGLGFTPVSDEHLSAVADWPKLEHLELGDKVTDVGLVELLKVQNLQSLCFMEANITDAGMTHLIALPKLKSLHLGKCLLSDEMLDRMYKQHSHIALGYGRRE